MVEKPKGPIVTDAAQETQKRRGRRKFEKLTIDQIMKGINAKPV